MHLSYATRVHVWPVFTKLLSYAITHKQGRATPTSTMDIPVTDTNFVNTLYNAHANRGTDLVLPHFSKSYATPPALKCRLGIAQTTRPVLYGFRMPARIQQCFANCLSCVLRLKNRKWQNRGRCKEPLVKF